MNEVDDITLAATEEPPEQPMTGVKEVDEALARLVELDVVGVDDHVALFENVHVAMRGALGKSDAAL